MIHDYNNEELPDSTYASVLLSKMIRFSIENMDEADVHKCVIEILIHGSIDDSYKTSMLYCWATSRSPNCEHYNFLVSNIATIGPKVTDDLFNILLFFDDILHISRIDETDFLRSHDILLHKSRILNLFITGHAVSIDDIPSVLLDDNVVKEAVVRAQPCAKNW